MAHAAAADDGAIAIRTAPAAPGEVAAVALWWRAGRMHEADTDAGAAHLLEHLVCDALPRHRVARWGGSVNGQSGREWTVWHALLPAALAPELVAALANALTAPLPDATLIAQEARVLAAERAVAKTRDDWELAALRAAFGDHPLARSLVVAPGAGRGSGAFPCAAAVPLAAGADGGRSGGRHGAARRGRAPGRVRR